jgi:hypothetical protein
MSESWALGWEALAAVGAAAATLVSLLALVFSARAARAAAQAAKAAGDQLAAQTVPVIVEVPLRALAEPETVTFFGGRNVDINWEGEVIFSAPAKGNDSVVISVPIQNVGAGLAQISEALLEIDRRSTEVSLIPVGSYKVVDRAEGDEGAGLVPSPIYLPPNGRHRLVATVFAHSPGVWDRINEATDKNSPGIRVLVDYADAGGRRRYETALRLYRSSEDPKWRIILDGMSRNYGPRDPNRYPALLE